MMDPKTTPVKLGILRTIYKAMQPIKYRLDAVLEDYYNKAINLSQAEHTAVLEFRSAAATVELLFTDYFEQAEEHKVDILHLPNKEFQLILDLSKTAELAFRAPIANSGLWVH